jgi:outer membrane protein assembly factor BamB
LYSSACRGETQGVYSASSFRNSYGKLLPRFLVVGDDQLARTGQVGRALQSLSEFLEIRKSLVGYRPERRMIRTFTFANSCSASSSGRYITAVISIQPAACSIQHSAFGSGAVPPPDFSISKEDGMNMRVKLLVAAVAILGQSSIAKSEILTTNWETNTVLAYDSTTGALKGTFAPSGPLSNYNGIARGPDGNIYVSTNPYPYNTGGGVLRFDGQSGAFINVFVAAGTGGLNNSLELHFASDGKLYVAGFTAGIVRFDGQTGAFLDNFIPPGSGGLIAASDAIFGPDHNLFVADNDGSQILRYDGTTGAFLNAFVAPGSGGLAHPASLQFGSDGKLYVADLGPDGGTGAIHRYDAITGAYVDDFVQPAVGLRYSDLQFGDDGKLYASSIYTNPGIYRYDSTTGGFIDKFITSAPGSRVGPTYFLLSPTAVPEPSSLLIMLLGGVCFLLLRHRGREPHHRNVH